MRPLLSGVLTVSVTATDSFLCATASDDRRGRRSRMYNFRNATTHTHSAVFLLIPYAPPSTRGGTLALDDHGAASVQDWGRGRMVPRGERGKAPGISSFDEEQLARRTAAQLSRFRSSGGVMPRPSSSAELPKQRVLVRHQMHQTICRPAEESRGTSLSDDADCVSRPSCTVPQPYFQSDSLIT